MLGDIPFKLWENIQKSDSRPHTRKYAPNGQSYTKQVSTVTKPKHRRARGYKSGEEVLLFNTSQQSK